VNRPRILIVDDDEQLCFVATRALETMANCDAVHSVTQATRALELGAYDLVLVDVALPGESGMAMLDRLRRTWPQTAALMLSGATDLSVAKEALDRGAVGYVLKPFRVRDLRIQVTAALASADRSTSAMRATNRARIVARLATLLESTAEGVCLVVDIEHVALLNASYGVEPVERLCDCVEERLLRAGSVEVLGRIGPATFVGVLTEQPGVSVTEAAHALHRALAVPAVVDGRRIPIAARAGVALTAPGDDADALLHLAEGAVLAARESGQPFVVYDGGAVDPVRVQQELLADAATAIHRGQLYVAYQPQQDLATAHCVGVEALARWNHPTHGDVPASVFIPFAERMDLIDELGAHVLRTACADIARVRRAPELSSTRVSVNASAAELRDREYPARVERALHESHRSPSALRLEVTESVTLDETEAVDRVLSDIQEMGVTLSIDDFGTGYSSFSILTRAPWAEIKLDRSLTAQYREPRGREMLRAIINYGTSLDIDVIAEGIETVEQRNAVHALGCRYAQGFLLGRPRPISALDRELRRTAA
jgi:EAL domain-containing protein (putative c-di-GMP-specific phosphodiesterase class I)/CheY-like chemotaxis protein